MKNFWTKLSAKGGSASEGKKPIFCLAPMADVTDCAFRQIIAKYGRPDIFWTEFVSADGLAHPVAQEKLLVDFIYSEKERPIVAQIFGSNPDNIKKAATLCSKLGFDGIDINMGCPDKSIEKQCAGAAMIKNPKLAREVIQAAKAGAESASRRMPVSIKTRLGYNKVDLDWIRELLAEDIAALTIHLRTRKEMSDVPAHWELMKEIVKIRDEMSKETLIIGNGDVANLDEAKQKVKETGCDGVMLGRAIFGNPFLFANKNVLSEVEGQISIKKKLKVMLEHTKLFEKLLGKHKNFAIMKKHFKAYANGFEGAKELRMQLMEAGNAKEVEEIIKTFLK